MKSRPHKSDGELRKASQHLDYEIQMFFASVDRLTVAGYQQADPILYNAILTAFTIYTRNLLDFFYPSNPWDDDMLATDYYDDPAFWKANRPEISDVLERTRKMVGKLSAHLTYARETIPEQDRWWIWRDIKADMQSVIGKFVETVPSNRLDPKIRSRLKIDVTNVIKRAD